MKIVFLGATKFSEEMLIELINNDFDIQAVFSIPNTFSLKKKVEKESKGYTNSNYADIESLAEENGIKNYIVSGDDQTLASYYDIIEKLEPDVILVLGWYYIVPKKIRKLAKIGTFGIHASMLPEYAGGSPLVWAIINGEERTGITMFKIEDGVDDGDILAQKELAIDFKDTIATLYGKVTDLSKKLLVSELNKLKQGKCTFIKQNKDLIHPFPIRTEADGLIEWKKKSLEIYNFVRAQTKPYPCAFSYFESRKVKFISVEPILEESLEVVAECGEVFLYQDQLLIKTGNFSIHPLEIEIEGVIYSFDEYFRNVKTEKIIFKDC